MTENRDPFAALEEAAKIQREREEAARRLSDARTHLVLGRVHTHAQPSATGVFFATLALGLRLKPCSSEGIETAATNGQELIYNPAWVNSLTPNELLGILAHEVMHCAMSHQSRRGAREHGKFNIACDLAINPILRDAGFTLPRDGIFPSSGAFKNMPTGLAAEEYYTLLPADLPGGQSNDPGGCGAVMDAGDQSQQAASEAAWQVAVSQAYNAAKQRGDLPAALERLIGEILETRTPWQEILREFLVRSLAKDDYTWFPPNRRYIWQGLYLPSMCGESPGGIAISVDTSGSISAQELNEFAAEVQGILECQPRTVHVIYHDAKVQGVEVWEPSQGPLQLKPKGGGGTSHKPVFDYIETLDTDIECLIALTDLDSAFPDTAPPYPVLWATKSNRTPPFGQVVKI